MNNKTLGQLIAGHAAEHPQRTWLRERRGDDITEYSWQEAVDQIAAIAAWIRRRFPEGKSNIGLLSKNRPHWFMADLAVITSGNVTVPLFTTLSREHAEYILDFVEAGLIFLGETENWDAVREVMPESAEIVTLPGVDCKDAHTRWDDIVAEHRGVAIDTSGDYDDVISVVFTSGTTGVPKGALQTHRSSIAPVVRLQQKAIIPEPARAFSYLPLAHIAERQLIEFYSIVYASEVTFNESLETLVRDLHDARPHYLFGAPRVWEQIQLGLIAKFGSPDEFDRALTEGGDAFAAAIRENLGLQDATYLVTGAAPAPPALLDWYWQLGLQLVEGYGQTEAMGLIGCTAEENRSGSIGKPADGVEIRIGKNDELLIRADGLSPGYYNRPEKTAELWQNGWLHTGDKASIDEDGFVFLSGRVKDYFKTIHGKFVAPSPIESDFAACPHVEQLCLLGRGYSKTAMVCVLTEQAAGEEQDIVEGSLRAATESINGDVYDHARIGAVLVTKEPWTIDNGILTPTLKIRRDEVEARFGDRARDLARNAAERHEILLDWL